MAQRNPLSRACRWHRRAPAVAVCLLVCQLAHAAGVKVEVRGVDELVRTNVLAYLSFERYRKGGAELNADTVERLHEAVYREHGFELIDVPPGPVDARAALVAGYLPTLT